MKITNILSKHYYEEEYKDLGVIEPRGLTWFYSPVGMDIDLVVFFDTQRGPYRMDITITDEFINEPAFDTDFLIELAMDRIKKERP